MPKASFGLLSSLLLAGLISQTALVTKGQSVSKFAQASSNSFLITTAAGWPYGTVSAKAASVPIPSPFGLAADQSGNIYFSSPANQIYRLDTAGNLTLVAGSLILNSYDPGDGGPAIRSSLYSTQNIAVDFAGNVYFSEFEGARVRKVTPGGIITVVAGNGLCCGPGDGGPATSNTLHRPNGIALDSVGNLYIADSGRIRKVTTDGIITTVAGTGGMGSSGDGVPALSASIDPSGLAMDDNGNLYFTETSTCRVRKVAVTGVISTIAGNHQCRFSGDGGPAIHASLIAPSGIAVTPSGDVVITDGQRIRMITRFGTISTLAGGATPGFNGDGGPALQASLNGPQGLAYDSSGYLYVADSGNLRVRRVTSTISTVAGTGIPAEDAVPPLFTAIAPSAAIRDTVGNLFIAKGNSIRKITPDGVQSTIAGSETAGFAGDNGPAVNALLNIPSALAIDQTGNLLIADRKNFRVRKIDANGIITTVAGNGMETYGGDGAAATSASLVEPVGLAVDSAGNTCIADIYGNRVRKVSANGIIYTAAGTGTSGFTGDGGAATAAQLSGPNAVAFDASGNLYISDLGNRRIRMVNPQGVIFTVAGSNANPNTGDGGPANRAGLSSTFGITVDTGGNLYIADFYHVRLVTPDGNIQTIAGNAAPFYAFADGGPASDASMEPVSLSASGGNIYVVDSQSRTVRLLIPAGTSPLLSVIRSISGNLIGGQPGSFTLTVSNAASAGSAVGTVTVTEYVPIGMTLVSMSGTGWTCAGIACTRSDPLPPGGSYPAITVNINVSTDAPGLTVNGATVSGGGSVMTGIQDLTYTNPAPPLMSSLPSSFQAGAISLGWKPTPQATSYEVSVGLSANPPVVASTTGGNYSATQLIPNRQYNWQITAKNVAGTGTVSGTLRTAPCASTVSPGGLTVPPAGGIISFLVDTGQNCQWTGVSSPVFWLNPVGGPSGQGRAFITYQVSPNSTGTPRSATITIGGNIADTTVTVTQAGGASCLFSLNQTLAALDNGSGAFAPLTASFVLTATNCSAADSWTATSDSPRLTVTSGTSGTGAVPSTSIRFAMLTNSSTQTQIAHVIVSGTMAGAPFSLPFEVVQSGSTEPQLQRVVRALYHSILGREPDSDGWAFWTGSGAPQDANSVVLLNAMADDFYRSPEFQNTGFAVFGIYQAVLGRLPACTEWNTAVATLRGQTSTTEQLISSLAPGVSNTAFVQTAITNGLGRPATTAEINTYAAQLSAGGTKSAFLNNLIFSNAAFQNGTNGAFVAMLYYTILVRDSDTAGFNFWLASVTNPPGQGGIYYVFNQPAGPYGLKLAVIGQAVPPNPNNLGFLGSTEFQGLIQ